MLECLKHRKAVAVFFLLFALVCQPSLATQALPKLTVSTSVDDAIVPVTQPSEKARTTMIMLRLGVFTPDTPEADRSEVVQNLTLELAKQLQLEWSKRSKRSALPITFKGEYSEWLLATEADFQDGVAFVTIDIQVKKTDRIGRVLVATFTLIRCNSNKNCKMREEKLRNIDLQVWTDIHTINSGTSLDAREIAATLTKSAARALANII